MKIFFKIIFLLIIFSVNAEAQTVTWQKLYTDESSNFSDAYSAVQLNDEGYIVVGNKVPSPGLSIFAIRLDKFGNLIWRKYYEGSNPRTIVKTNDGNFLIGANVLTKINIDGDVIWRRPDAPSFRINLSEDGGFYFCGAVEVGPLKSIPSIKRYDSLGFLIWDKVFDNEIYRGGFSNCIIDNENNLVLIGIFSPGDTIYDYPFIMKTDALGNVIWLKKYGYDSLKYFYITNIVESVQNNYLVSGSNSLCYLVKFDSIGNWIWVKYYESSYADPGSFNFLTKTIDNGLVIIGSQNVDTSYFVRLIKTDFDGNTQWTELYGVGQYADGQFVNQTSDIGYIITGRRDTFNRAQVYVIKTDKNGNTSPYVNIITVSDEIPESFILYQNYPNPFNPETKITFDIRSNSLTELIVYSVTGQKIIQLLSKNLNPGKYSIDFNINNFDLNLPSGIYFYSLKAGNNIITRKMLLIK